MEVPVERVGVGLVEQLLTDRTSMGGRIVTSGLLDGLRLSFAILASSCLTCRQRANLDSSFWLSRQDLFLRMKYREGRLKLELSCNPLDTLKDSHLCDLRPELPAVELPLADFGVVGGFRGDALRCLACCGLAGDWAGRRCPAWNVDVVGVEGPAEATFRNASALSSAALSSVIVSITSGSNITGASRKCPCRNAFTCLLDSFLLRASHSAASRLWSVT